MSYVKRINEKKTKKLEVRMNSVKITGMLSKGIYSFNEAIFGAALAYIWKMAVSGGFEMTRVIMAVAAILFSVIWHRPLRKRKEAHDAVYNDKGEVIREKSLLREKIMLSMSDIGIGVAAAGFLEIANASVSVVSSVSLLIIIFEVMPFTGMSSGYMASDGFDRIVRIVSSGCEAAFVMVIMALNQRGEENFNVISYLIPAIVGVYFAWSVTSTIHGGDMKRNVICLSGAAVNLIVQIFIGRGADFGTIYRTWMSIVLVAEAVSDLVGTLNGTHLEVSFPDIEDDYFT